MKQTSLINLLSAIKSKYGYTTVLTPSMYEQCRETGASELDGTEADDASDIVSVCEGIGARSGVRAEAAAVDERNGTEWQANNDGGSVVVQ